MAKNQLQLNVKFTKIGNRIKFNLPVKMYCNHLQHEIPSQMIFDITPNIGIIAGADVVVDNFLFDVAYHFDEK